MNLLRKPIIHGFLTVALWLGWVCPPLTALERSDIFTTGTVHSFGNYEVKGKLAFDIARSGSIEIGRLQVSGLYNGPYPWVMKVYTENTNFQGISGRVTLPSRAGLVSLDGRFAVPLQIHTPNLAVGQFVPIPDRSDPSYVMYVPPPEPGQRVYTERIVIGIDPRNADWVAGPDGLLFTSDDNPLGDITIPTPFTLTFRAIFDAASAEAQYKARLIIEVVGAP